MQTGFKRSSLFSFFIWAVWLVVLFGGRGLDGADIEYLVPVNYFDPVLGNGVAMGLWQGSFVRVAGVDHDFFDYQGSLTFSDSDLAALEAADGPLSVEVACYAPDATACSYYGTGSAVDGGICFGNSYAVGVDSDTGTVAFDKSLVMEVTCNIFMGSRYETVLGPILVPLASTGGGGGGVDPQPYFWPLWLLSGLAVAWFITYPIRKHA